MDASPREIRTGVAEREVLRGSERARDWVAVEEPLEIRVTGDAVAITMRTPGHDAELAAGFLYAEGIIRALDELSSLAHCGRPGTEAYGNVIDARPSGGVVLDVERAQASRRGTLTTSACGVCGRRSIDDLLALCSPLPPGPVIARDVLFASVDALRARQEIFQRTGGTHGALALDGSGKVLAVHEDVGRHNAVDKVVGALLHKGLVGPKAPVSPRPMVLTVSGRASFEIIQKAAVARIPIVASVSAPSTLAIDLAEKAGIALAGFVRGAAFNVYSHPERLGA